MKSFTRLPNLMTNRKWNTLKLFGGTEIFKVITPDTLKYGGNLMKKFFALALAAMMAASLVGCSSGVSQ